VSFVSFDEWRSSVLQARQEEAWEREEREWRAEWAAGRSARRAAAAMSQQFDLCCLIEDTLITGRQARLPSNYDFLANHYCSIY
jgi:hypothetical protein